MNEPIVRGGRSRLAGAGFGPSPRAPRPRRMLAAIVAVVVTNALAAAGCDRRDGVPSAPKPAVGEAGVSGATAPGPSAVAPASGGVSLARVSDPSLPPWAPLPRDPSLPDAAQVFSEPPKASPAAAETPPSAGQDTSANVPKQALDQDREQQSMPYAGHGNNHSSPTLGTSQGTAR